MIEDLMSGRGDYSGFGGGISYFSFCNGNGIKKYQRRFGLNEARRFGSRVLR